jgi:hypothetical protein
MRIVLAVISIWVIGAAQPEFAPFTNDELLVIGFVIGFFPRVFWQIIEHIFKRLTRRALPSMQSDLPLSDLDGLTVWHEARLEEEDIENIPNMATADAVELMLNTRITPERLIDWIDQAILYTQIGAASTERRRSFRLSGIRTATDLIVATRRSSGVQQAANEDDLQQRESIIAALVTSSNLKLVLQWKGVSVNCTSHGDRS